MAITQIGITVGGNKKEYQGLSTDAKPTSNVGSGSIFYEIDSKKGWVFDAVNINAVTSNGWWEI